MKFNIQNMIDIDSYKWQLESIIKDGGCISVACQQCPFGRKNNINHRNINHNEDCEIYCFMANSLSIIECTDSGEWYEVDYDTEDGQKYLVECAKIALKKIKPKYNKLDL